jgi:hypothetical protein
MDPGRKKNRGKVHIFRHIPKYTAEKKRPYVEKAPKRSLAPSRAFILLFLQPAETNRNAAAICSPPTKTFVHFP